MINYLAIEDSDNAPANPRNSFKITNFLLNMLRLIRENPRYFAVMFGATTCFIALISLAIFCPVTLPVLASIGLYGLIATPLSLHLTALIIRKVIHKYFPEQKEMYDRSMLKAMVGITVLSGINLICAPFFLIFAPIALIGSAFIAGATLGGLVMLGLAVLTQVLILKIKSSRTVSNSDENNSAAAINAEEKSSGNNSYLNNNLKQMIKSTQSTISSSESKTSNRTPLLMKTPKNYGTENISANKIKNNITDINATTSYEFKKFH